MSNCWRDDVKGRPVIQKRESWNTTPYDVKDFVSAAIVVFGEMSRVMIITHKGYFDTGRYYDNKDKTGRQKGR